MTAFTFEYFRKSDEPVLREKIEVSNPAAIWCHVEALALRLGEKGPGAFIRVRNEQGQAVVRTGVATAMASIRQCPCGGCELKEMTARGEKKFDSLRLPPCRSLGSCACKIFTPQGNQTNP